jgi:hypothetical protein
VLPSISIGLGYRCEGRSVIIFLSRPLYRDPSRLGTEDVAKARYAPSRDLWKIYWLKADLKWHIYQPLPEVSQISTFLAEVESDPYCCFRG